MHAGHHPLAGAVVEDRPLATHRLADERLLAGGVGAAPHHGRMELDELDVADVEARRAARWRPVAGHGRRVRRRREHLAETAGGEHDGARP